MDTVEPTVFVVDDEAPIRDSLRWLIESVDLTVDTYASGTEFLDAYDRSRTGCLILDIRMPGMSGLDVQQQLQAQSIDLPVIFLTGHGGQFKTRVCVSSRLTKCRYEPGGRAAG